MGELHLVDEVAWDPNAVLVEIDQRVDSAEDDGIRARWEFGQELLFQRVGEQLPKGRLDEVALLIGKSRSEVKHRMKFASDYPTAEEVDNAVSHFGSWHAIVNKVRRRAS